MSEEQKKLFIEWLDDNVETIKKLASIKYCDIEGLDELACLCTSYDGVQLDESSFKYAVECLNPAITEKVLDGSYLEKAYIQRAFKYKDTRVFALFDVEG